MDYSKMTLREKVLQTFIVTIREINMHGGPEEFFDKYPVGGMYFYEAGAHDIDDGRDQPIEEASSETAAADCYRVNGKEMGTAMPRATLEACKKASKQPLFICADGALLKGQIKNMAFRSVTASRNLEDAYNLGKVMGMQMNEFGIDWILQPAFELLMEHIPYYGIAVSDDPDLIIEVYKQIIRGIQDQGVCATAKHFPGYANCGINPHCGPGHNWQDFEEWSDTYGRIFKALIDDGVYSILTSHMDLISYDPDIHDGFLPSATYSYKLTTELLKGKLGFNGAVVTDALPMGGSTNGNPVEEAVQAFKAGADLLLWPPIEAADRIAECLESGEIPMSRLEDALTRIQKMRTFREETKEKREAPSFEFVNESLYKIAEHGICMLRNGLGLLPVTAEKCKKVLIIDAIASGDASTLLKEELQARGINADVKKDIYDPYSLLCWKEETDALQSQYDLVVIHMDLDYGYNFSIPFMLVWNSHFFDRNKKVIVNYGSPYFADNYLPQDPTYIEVNTIPTKESIKMVADTILGDLVPVGHTVFGKKEGK